MLRLLTGLYKLTVSLRLELIERSSPEVLGTLPDIVLHVFVFSCSLLIRSKPHLSGLPTTVENHKEHKEVTIIMEIYFVSFVSFVPFVVERVTHFLRKK